MDTKLTVLSILLTFLAIYLNSSTIISVFFPPRNSNLKKLLTVEEIKTYDGVTKPELYLSLLGKVFDVTKGKTHYGPGCTYNFFVGKDSSRSFVSGNFNEANDHVSDLNSEELRSLNHWVKFYKKEYKMVGKLIGRYYNEEGKLTRYGEEVRKLVKKAEEEKNNEDLEKTEFPPCNVEWDAVRGTRVWCTKQSGGISRDWVGHPRQFYQPGSKEYRCACVKSVELSGNLKEYENCGLEEESCYIK